MVKTLPLRRPCRAGRGGGLALALLGLAGCPPPEEDLGARLEVVEVVVVADPDRDGRLAPGERAQIEVTVLNRGTEDNGYGRCAVTTETAGVTIDPLRDDGLTYGSCSPGERCGDTFNLEVAPSVLEGTVIAFRCTPETDGAELTFEVTIRAPDVVPAVADLVVLDDADRDGVLNPGETARVQVLLANLGTSDLTASRCVVGSETPGVVVQSSDETLDYQRCAAGQTCGPSDLRVAVGPEVPPGTSARFTCALVDDGERAWPMAFALPIEGPAAVPRFDALEVLDDTDRDGRLAPGESARLRITLQNIGVSALPSARCVVTSATPWLTVSPSDDILDFNFCAADATCNASDIRVIVEAEAPMGGSAVLECALVDARGLGYEVQIPIDLGP